MPAGTPETRRRPSPPGAAPPPRGGRLPPGAGGEGAAHVARPAVRLAGAPAEPAGRGLAGLRVDGLDEDAVRELRREGDLEPPVGPGRSRGGRGAILRPQNYGGVRGGGPAVGGGQAGHVERGRGGGR